LAAVLLSRADGGAGGSSIPAGYMAEDFYFDAANITRWALLYGMLTAVVYVEIKTSQIRNALTIPCLLLGLLLNTVIGFATIGGIEGLLWSAMGCGVGFCVFFFVYLVGLMLNYKFLGGGDVKLMGAIGAIAGVKFTFVVMYWTVWIAAIMGVFVLVRHGVFLKGLVRSMRIFFFMPPDEEGEKPKPEGAVFLGLAIAIAALLASWQLRDFR
jgi:prepilin signal peptidase PulO-like enzyme (type II secretory pathway)